MVAAIPQKSTANERSTIDSLMALPTLATPTGPLRLCLTDACATTAEPLFAQPPFAVWGALRRLARNEQDLRAQDPG